jgi:hypothetical protein
MFITNDKNIVIDEYIPSEKSKYVIQYHERDTKVMADYQEGTAVMLFYQIGELFQSYAVGKSRRNISELMDIRPDYANIEQDGKLVPVHQTAEYKEALDWMRKIYADGLVRPDWATVDTANFQVDTQKGVTGVFVDTMDGSKRIWKYFEDNAVADVNDASKIATMTSVGPIIPAPPPLQASVIKVPLLFTSSIASK